MRKICIDGRYIGKSGLGTYTELLIWSLKGFELKLLINTDQKLENRYSSIVKVYTEIKPNSFQNYFLLYKTINSLEIDLFWSVSYSIPLFLKYPSIITVHDTLQLNKDYYPYTFFSLVYKLLLKYSLKHADYCLTVSQFSKKELLKFFPKTRIPIAVIFPVNNSRLDRRILYPKNKSNTKVILIANLKKHKNLYFILNALHESQYNIELTIIGSNANMLSSDQRSISMLTSPNIVLRHYEKVSENQLNQLVTQSDLLISPSLYEGFGLPPYEAICSGTIPLISKIEVYNEVYPFVRLKFNPYDIQDFYKKFDKFMKMPDNERNSLIDTYQKEISKPKFKSFNKRILKILEKIEEHTANS